jgi:hypothetical protein
MLLGPAVLTDVLTRLPLNEAELATLVVGYGNSNPGFRISWTRIQIQALLFIAGMLHMNGKFSFQKIICLWRDNEG